MPQNHSLQRFLIMPQNATVRFIFPIEQPLSLFLVRGFRIEQSLLFISFRNGEALATGEPGRGSCGFPAKQERNEFALSAGERTARRCQADRSGIRNECCFGETTEFCAAPTRLTRRRGEGRFGTLSSHVREHFETCSRQGLHKA